jgi:ubiquinone/menaquinone biosynthesis C-methylase UbiE
MAKLSVTPDIERGGALRDLTAIGHLRRWPERASREMAGSGEAGRTTPPYNFVMAIYPRIFAALYDLSFHRGERAGMAERRRRLLATAQGRVLEIGAGTGLNLPYYTDAVSELVLTEPEAPMARRLARRAGGREVVSARAEALPFADASFDTVVSTLVLCTVEDPAGALAEARRVLRPGGRLLFIEHVRADGGLARWQDRLEGLWRHVGNGCHANRDTLTTLSANGFAVSDVETATWRKMPRLVRPLILGHAVKT